MQQSSVPKYLSLACVAVVSLFNCHVSIAQIDHNSADRLLADGHYLRAEQMVRTAAERNPGDAHALSNLSILEWSLSRLDAAISAGERAVAAAPNSAEAHAHLADALGAKLIVSTSSTMEKISLAHRFRKEIDRTLEIDPNNPDSLQDLAQFYWHAPGLVGGDKNKARQTADKLFQVSPSRGATARADFATDDKGPNQRASTIVGIWQAAVAARPNDYDSHAALAAAYLDQVADANHLANAEAEAKRARAIDGTRIDAYKTLAVVYAKAGRWDEFDSALKQAKASVPDDRAPEFAAATAILAEKEGARLQRAEALLRDYLAQTPEAQEPTHAMAHWRLGQVLERQGRKADAVRELQLAVNQDGSLDGAKKDLKRLS